MRLENNTVTNKSTKKDEYKTTMSLKDFCDKFTFRVSKVKDTNEKQLHLQARTHENVAANSYYPL